MLKFHKLLKNQASYYRYQYICIYTKHKKTFEHNHINHNSPNISYRSITSFYHPKYSKQEDICLPFPLVIKYKRNPNMYF